MRNISRKDFLKIGAALPLAMHSLSLRAEQGENGRQSGLFLSIVVWVSISRISIQRSGEISQRLITSKA